MLFCLSVLNRKQLFVSGDTEEQPTIPLTETKITRKNEGYYGGNHGGKITHTSQYSIELQPDF